MLNFNQEEWRKNKEISITYKRIGEDRWTDVWRAQKSTSHAKSDSSDFGFFFLVYVIEETKIDQNKNQPLNVNIKIKRKNG